MPPIELRPMSGGEVLDRSFQIYRAHFLPLFLAALVVFLPLALLYAAVGITPDADFTGAAGVAVIVLALLMLVVSVMAWAALTWMVEWAVLGEDVSVGRGYRQSVRAAPRLVLLWIVLYLLLVAMIFAAAIPAAIIVALAEGAGTGLAGGIAAAVVALAGAGVGLIWWGGLATISAPALVLERLGAVASVKRARSLSKGARVRITGLMFLTWVMVALPVVGVLLVLGMVSTLWDPGAVQQLTTTQLYVQQLLTWTIWAATMPYMVAVMVMLYYDRRIRREGWDVELAAPDLTA